MCLVPNFSQFGEHEIFGTKFAQDYMNDNIFKK